MKKKLKSYCRRVLNATQAEVHRRLGFEQLEEKVDSLANAVSTWTVTNWIEHATLQSLPLISVILPTHNRSNLLSQAIRSVGAQVYRNWEIVVADDDSTDDTQAVVGKFRNELGDERLQAVKIPHGGVCAARNAALARARGEHITYLDDDNVMHPLWLKAVAWAFAQRPDVDVIYGGMIVDDFRRVTRVGGGDLPTYFLHPYDRKRLTEQNLADIGQIAHRGGLPGASFDESLREMGDWDLLLRLTKHKAPLVLPVLACLYTTSAPDRLTNGPTFRADEARVREKARS